jgi:hypothetical protein
VNWLIDDFAATHPDKVVRRGNEIFVSADAVHELLEQAQRTETLVLGLEGFIVDDESVYPALSRIADFSRLTPEEAAGEALALVNGPWRLPPTPSDQMHSEARGRHMIVVVLG